MRTSSCADAGARGMLFDVRRFSVNDGPGIRTTVFFKGCPLSCLWCHNPESQSYAQEVMFHENRCIKCGACAEACTSGAIKRTCVDDSTSVVTVDQSLCTSCGRCVPLCVADARLLVGREYTASQVMQIIARDMEFYEESGGGVTFSGGEPLSQPKLLKELLQLCKSAGIHTAVDTCGQAAWSVFSEIFPLVDLWLYDIKAASPSTHKHITGKDNSLPISNLRQITSLGATVIIRAPIVPTLNDSLEDIEGLCGILVGLCAIQHTAVIGDSNGVQHPTAQETLSLEVMGYHSIGNHKYAALGPLQFKPT
ncbi:glycyl-radical enzyme activating protein [Pelomyxa schiedti]|nr:glycyl-radical enzyme activating protein [Pelomyxa schiedti]